MASTYELIVKAVDKTSGPLSKIQRNLDKVNKSASKASTGMKGVSGGAQTAGFAAVGASISRITPALLGVAAVAGTVAVGFKTIIASAREFETLENQLRLVTQGTADLERTTDRLRQMAQANRSSFAATAELYVKLRVATEELGMSTNDVEEITTKLSQALQVAGADAGTSAGVIKQFGQAMASGVVRGDEFNSIVEGLGPALAIMARESNITVGELRKMAMNGELTAEVFANMLLNSNSLTESFEKMNTTISQLETLFGDTFDKLLVTVGDVTGITDNYNKTLENTINLMNQIDAALSGEDFFNKIGDPTTIEGVKKRIEQLNNSIGGNMEQMKAIAKEAGIELEGLFNKFGGAGNLEALIKGLTDPFDFKSLQDLNTEIIHTQKEVERLTAVLNHLEKTKAQQALDSYKDAIVRLAEEPARAAKALSDLRKNELLPFEKLIKQSIGTDSIFALATPIEQTKMKIAELQSAIIALNNANDDAGVNVSNYKGKIEGLNQALLIQEANLKKLTTEAINAGTGLSGLDLFMHNLIGNATRSANELMFAQQAVKILNDMLQSGKINIDQYAQAMLTLKGSTEKAKDELEQIKNPLSQFDQFMKDLVESSREAATEQTNFLQAEKALNAQLKAGLINLDTYAFAMEKVKQATEGAAKAAEENKDAFKIGLSTAESLAMIEKQIALEDDLLARKKAVLEAGGGGERLREELGLKKAELTFEQELNKEFREKAEKLEEVNKALAKVSVLAKEAGVSEKFLTEELEKQQQVLQENLGQYQAKAMTVSEAIEKGFTEMTMSIGQELATAIRTGENLFDALSNAFDRMLDNILQQIIQSQINAALGKLFDIGPTPGGGGGLGSMLTSFLGTPTVGAPMGGLKFPKIPFLANGGIAKKGQPSIVGDGGEPELFIPGQTGRVTPMSQLNTGGGKEVNVVFNLNAVDTQTGVEFLLKNKPQIIGMVSQGFNQRGRAGITS